MPPMPGECDHCGQRRDLKTHLLPWTTRPNRQGDQPRPLHTGLRCLLLCERCGDQRTEDLRRYFRGGQATELVAVETPQPTREDWSTGC